MQRLVVGVLSLWCAVACGGGDEASAEPGAGATGGGVGAGGTAAAGGGVGTGDADGAGGTSAGGAKSCEGPLLPLAVGNSWTYRVTDSSGGVSTKTTTIDGMQVVGGSGPNSGKMAFHAVTTKTTGAVTDTTESWQDAIAGGTVVRYREISYQAGTAQVAVEDSWDPYKLRVDGTPEHTQVGATWTELYTEAKLKGGVATSQSRSDGWVIDAVDVPCGPVKGQTFSCLRVRKSADGTAAGKTYLFARCIGKVREEGTQTEELTDYQVN